MQKEANVKVNRSLSDPEVTALANTLYVHLRDLMSKGIMFGHQDDLAYGVNWKYEEGRCDIKEVTGDYPAVFGWELGHLEINSPVNLDSVPFNKMKDFILKGFEMGSIITISWHLHNPLNGKSAWDTDPETVRSILPVGKKHDVYKEWLDKVAVFVNALTTKEGQLIPVIFRPFHEWNGRWFWWGKEYCSADEFKALWKFTVSYLRGEKNIHHLLYAFNSDKFYSEEEYMERYPGDEWVDLVGFDIYQRDMDNYQYRKILVTMLTNLERIAEKHNKIPALTEFGGVNTDSVWWTKTFLPVLRKHKLSYVLGWRNAGLKNNGEFEYYVPYKGDVTADGFREFYRDSTTLFQTDLLKERIYK